MGRSERKAAYHLLLVLIGALVMGCLLVVVLMGPMGAAQADQQRPHENKKEQNKTVRVSAAGENDYRAKGDENPVVYKSVDSRSGFEKGYYRHVLRCGPGYKAIGGGWDFNNPTRRNPAAWYILATRHADGGETWIVDAYGDIGLFKRKLPTFTAYAACVPRELLSGLRYAHESTTIAKNETKTIKATCASDERAIGGGFEFGSTHLDLVRSERSRGDERSWETGARRGSTSGSNSLNNWAVCLSRGALEDTQYLEATDRSDDRAVANTPRCPQGTYLLSGGAGMPNDAYDGISNPRWSNSSPPNEGAQSWKASAIQIGYDEATGYIPTLKVHAFALCGRFA